LVIKNQVTPHKYVLLTFAEEAWHFLFPKFTILLKFIGELSMAKIFLFFFLELLNRKANPRALRVNGKIVQLISANVNPDKLFK
jgi:hypothetical protein